MSEQNCPICGTAVQPNPRYPRYICRDCAKLATAPDGRALRFFNRDVSGGYLAIYADDEQEYASHDCFVRGMACHADEARFGGVVIQVKE